MNSKNCFGTALTPIAGTCAIIWMVTLDGLCRARTDTAPPTPEELCRQAGKELEDLETLWSEQRVNGRMKIVEKEEQLRAAERTQPIQRQKDLTDLENAASHQKAVLAVAANPNSEEISKANTKYNDAFTAFEHKEDQRVKQIVKLRKELVEAEEQMRLLERKQDIQRHLAYARLKVAEARLGSRQK